MYCHAAVPHCSPSSPCCSLVHIHSPTSFTRSPYSSLPCIATSSLLLVKLSTWLQLPSQRCFKHVLLLAPAAISWGVLEVLIGKGKVRGFKFNTRHRICILSAMFLHYSSSVNISCTVISNMHGTKTQTVSISVYISRTVFLSSA